MNWKKIAFLLYPLFITLLLICLCLRSSIPIAVAGTIRRIEITPDRPVIIRLAQSRTTAVSFSVRPEKVVPGNPDALELNFLGRDLTIRPLGPRPGNLIVYTKSSRYVILLQLSSEAGYDDAVTLVSAGSKGKILKLSDDSFQVVDFKMTFPEASSNRTASGQLSHVGRVLLTQELPLPLRCKGCLIKKRDDSVELSCSHDIIKIECSTSGRPFVLERATK